MVLSAPNLGQGPPDYDYYAPPGPSRLGNMYGNRYPSKLEEEPLSETQQKYLRYENLLIKYLKPVFTGLLGPLVPTVVINFNQKQ